MHFATKHGNRTQIKRPIMCKHFPNSRYCSVAVRSLSMISVRSYTAIQGSCFRMLFVGLLVSFVRPCLVASKHKNCPTNRAEYVLRTQVSAKPSARDGHTRWGATTALQHSKECRWDESREESIRPVLGLRHALRIPAGQATAPGRNIRSVCVSVERTRERMVAG